MVELQRFFTDSYTWLQALTSGEATLYGIMLATAILFLAWWLTKSWKKQSVLDTGPQSHVDSVQSKTGGVSIGMANGSPIMVYNLTVPDEVVRLHAGKTNLPQERAIQITRDFLTLIEKYYRYLALKGMGDNSGLRLHFSLVEMLIPLNARLTIPGGDTLIDNLRSTGRSLTQEEKEQLGGSLDKSRPVLELIQQHSVLVLLGDPGSGKSTLVRFLAYLLATGQGRAIAMVDYLPLLLPLAAYSERLSKQPDLNLRQFAVEYFQEMMDLDDLNRLLNARLQQGKVLILLDGLDEVKEIHLRNTVVNRVQLFLCQQIDKGNRVIMTSRIVGYKEVRLPEIEGLRECTLLDFDENEIADFILRWTTIVERQVYDTGKVSGYEAAREATELITAVNNNPAIRKLAANPLLLTMLVIQKRQGISLPRHRVVLYEQYIASLLRDWLLARNVESSSNELPNDRMLRKVLEPLALWLQESEPGKGLVNEQDLLAWLREYFINQSDPDAAARQFISDVREHSGLLIDRGGRRFGFMHLTFMEYLAGVTLAGYYQQGLQEVVSRICEHADQADWRETILLGIGHLGLNLKLDQAATDLLAALLDAR